MKKVILLCIMAVGVLLLLFCRIELLQYSIAQESLPRYIGKSIEVVGVVANDPEKRETNLHANVSVESINGKAAKGTLLAILPRESALSYGDTVTMQGALVAPQAFQTDTGHIFDYPNYLRVQGVSAIMSRATLLDVQSGAPSVLGSLYSLKYLFESSVEKLFPEPDGSLLEGILLGERRGIPKDLNNAFISSSLVHVVVLSGYNISIVSEGVFRSLAFMPQVAQYSLGATLMVLFALMSGAGSTTIRALTMALVALMARYMKRRVLALRTLLFAGVLMIFWNPLVALYDPSFILSMLATFGLITLSPFVERHLPRFLLKYPSLASIAASTIAVQIFVLPALLYFTGTLSLLALPANLLVLPIVSFAMGFGFIAGIVGLLSPMLAFIPALISDVLLKWMILVAQEVASVPYGTATVPAFSGWFVVGVYVPLVAVATWLHVRTAPLLRPN